MLDWKENLHNFSGQKRRSRSALLLSGDSQPLELARRGAGANAWARRVGVSPQSAISRLFRFGQAEVRRRSTPTPAGVAVVSSSSELVSRSQGGTVVVVDDDEEARPLGS